MAKPVINYKGHMTENPADRAGAKICIPQIVDRNQVLTLEQVVVEAIDRGLIAGLKSSAAKSIADGTMIQLGKTLNGGTGVIFGEFFAVRPYLTGTIENMLAPITSANKLRVRFVPGSAYKLDEKDFSFHNVTAAENVPKVTTVAPASTTGADGTWAPAEGVNIVGANLKLKASDEVQIYNCDAETPVLADTFHGSEVDPEYGDVNTDPVLTINKEWVNAHSQNWGVKMGFKVVKKITVDNVEQTIESNMFVATKAS